MSETDERSQLVYNFAEAVIVMKPWAFVMENVDHLGKSPRFNHTRMTLLRMFKGAVIVLKKKYSSLRDFGVLQRRKRYFIIGLLKPKAELRFLPRNGQVEFDCWRCLALISPPGEPGNERTINAKITMAASPVMVASPYAGMLFNGLGRPIDLLPSSNSSSNIWRGNKTPIVDERELRGGADPWIVEYHSQLKEGLIPVYGEAPSFLRRLTVGRIWLCCKDFREISSFKDLKLPNSDKLAISPTRTCFCRR